MARRPETDTGPFAELMPDYAQHKETALHARSPVRWPERLHNHTPLLLLHGSTDWRVHPTRVLAMASALYTSRHPFGLVFFEGGDHGLSEYQEEVELLVTTWLDRYVRSRTPWPGLEPQGW